MTRPGDFTMHRHPARRTQTIRRGFTLVEVIVIVTVLALLMTVVATRLTGVFGRGQSEIARSQAAKISQAYTLYMIDVASAPEDNFDLSILTMRPDEGGGPGGPYLPKQSDVFDPWGNEFIVVVPGVENYDYDILSLGADGAPGGEQANADVTQ